jgi:hypothetical protein
MRRRDPSRWLCGILYPQKVGTNFVTSGGRSVGIARLQTQATEFTYFFSLNVLVLKLVVCILLRVLGQVQGFRLTQHWFEYFIQ